MNLRDEATIFLVVGKANCRFGDWSKGETAILYTGATLEEDPGSEARLTA